MFLIVKNHLHTVIVEFLFAQMKPFFYVLCTADFLAWKPPCFYWSPERTNNSKPCSSMDFYMFPPPFFFLFFLHWHNKNDIPNSNIKFKSKPKASVNTRTSGHLWKVLLRTILLFWDMRLRTLVILIYIHIYSVEWIRGTKPVTINTNNHKYLYSFHQHPCLSVLIS